jgi:peptide/nickel transport system substrate-binding protein
MNRHTRRTALMMGGAAALLAACGRKADTSKDLATSAAGTQAAAATTAATQAAAAQATVPAGKSGGTLVFRGDDLQQLDFQRTISTPSQDASSLVFSRLMVYDPYTDLNTYVLRPDLAESWEQTPDRVTFKLRKGVKWQNIAPLNGRELTAQDIKYSLERVGTNKPEYVHSYKVELITGIETPDASTLVLKLKQPSASLLTDLASGQGLGVVPREVIEADGDLDKRWVGSGPFMLDKWEKGNFIRFVKNPTYYKPGLPYLDAIERRFIRDSSTALANYLAGQLQYFAADSKEQSDQIKKTTKSDTKDFPNLGGTHKLYNVGPKGNPQLRDLRVRQAIDLALDREKLLELVLGGDGVWGGTFVPLGFGDWSLTESELKQLYAPNPTEARKLLDAAGVQRLQITNEYSNISTFSQDEGPLMKEMLAKVGIDLVLKPQERTVYLQSQVDSDFILQSIGMGAYPDPDNYLYPTFHTRGSKNYGKASNPELDAKIEKQQTILDRTERVKYMKDLQKEWKNYLFRTYSVYPNTHQSWQPNVKGQFVPKGWDWQGMEAVSFA